MSKHTVFLLSIVSGLALSIAQFGCAQVPPTDVADTPPPDNNEPAVAMIHEQNLKKHGKNPDMMVLPGLLADRKAQRVIIQAEATGLDTKGNPPEFFLIGQHSGHGYEALALSFAKPGDIHKALVFIGMEPGRPVNVRELQLWPKGERVIMTFAAQDPDKPFGPVRVESLFLDEDTRKPLQNAGLVFTGSVMIDSIAEPGKKVYAADAREPASIASNYNESESVLDVPWQATKAAVYGHSIINPEFVLPTNQLLTVTIEPEYKDGNKRVMDLTLDVTVSADEKTQGKLAYRILATDGKVVNKTNDAAGMINFFRTVCQKGHDPFVTLRPGNMLTIGAVRNLCAGLASVESASGIRLEPPPEGHLFYKAFLSEDKYRDRAQRHAQPWELHFAAKNSGYTVTLTKVEQIWKETGDLQPDLKASDFPVAAPQSLPKLLQENGPGLPVIFVFAPSALTYGELMSYLKPVLSTHGIVYVYVD
jgi:hypothetical protein